uniref:Dynein axonemal intermediate chain 4 n=1 Tax=Chromera velia CCMP2878 TaxID=1169474 RepID=A0A0G4I0J3_9ALVE|eukprot:Cvel_1635.t1-p1 / transcript=Cvel_1635.t1 / gene=Cvel_1635 / organism=Chromera_velia_CCMP2878 / gene_product=WD repeat-containing protein 78, putative / transcript_product=WD repeat-containing protein 78, putative / location=Cvel_scaffold58:115321-124501(+) / protein_length=928 / sequence_SO=supercontig / SO=protein_coding / is_pseudo=false
MSQRQSALPSKPSLTNRHSSGGKSNKLQANVSLPKSIGKSASSANRSKMKNQSSSEVNKGEMHVLLNDKDVTPKPLLSSTAQATPAEGDDLLDAIGKKEVDDADFEEPTHKPNLAVAGGALDKSGGGEKQKALQLTEEELEKEIEIILEETPTMELFHSPSLIVTAQTDDYEKIMERNKAYEALLKNRENADQYASHHAQTLDNPQKPKEITAAPPLTSDAQVEASQYEIFDAFQDTQKPRQLELQDQCSKQANEIMGAVLQHAGTLLDVTTTSGSSEAGTARGRARGREGDSQASIRGGNSSLKGKRSTSSPSRSRERDKGKKTGGGTKQGDKRGRGLEAKQLSGSAPSRQPSERDESVGPGGTKGGKLEGDAEGEGGAGETEGQKEPEDPMPWTMGADATLPEALKDALRVMERIVSQNVFHKQHMIYRNYPTIEELQAMMNANERGDDEGGGGRAGGHRGSIGGRSKLGKSQAARSEAGGGGAGLVEETSREKEEEGGRSEVAKTEEGGPSEKEGGGKDKMEGSDDGDSLREVEDPDGPRLSDLFCFECHQLTGGLSATAAEWNKSNQDVLAVSYGDLSELPAGGVGGLVLFWSLKNPSYPERVLRTASGVTSLQFSTVYPNLVAAGMHDGSIAIWDLRRPGNAPVVESSEAPLLGDKKHADAVWGLRYVDRGADKMPREFLASVSSDGRVLTWSTKKGLESSLLMMLKRMPNPRLGNTSNHKEGVIFRQASGMGLDFPRTDPSSYLIGTEDGLIHRCSTSYNEQYLDTYYGHAGPVYKVRFNPYWADVFLSASADWSMRLWSVKTTDEALFTYQSTDLSAAVNDVVWSPHNSMAFAACMDDGRVEMWDLDKQPLDPIVVHYPGRNEGRGHRQRTCVGFSLNSPVLVAGDVDGSVEVMRMYHMETPGYSSMEQQERLKAYISRKK